MFSRTLIFTSFFVALLSLDMGYAKQKATIMRHPDDPRDSLLDAAMYGDVENMRDLIQRLGKDVNEKSPDGESALHTACIHGYSDALALLLESGASPDVRASASKSLEMTPLSWCVHTGETDAVDTLIQGGANVNLVVRDVEGGRITALDIALKFLGEDHEVTRLLKSAGARTWNELISAWESTENREFKTEDWRRIPGVFLGGDRGSDSEL
eukprot:g2778.t1